MAEKLNKTTQKYKDILKSGKIGEQELISLRSYLGSSKISNEDRDMLLELVYKKPLKLTKDHQQKGIDWLISQYKTPAGKLKSSSPFGFRETSILENWKEAELGSLQNTSTFGKYYTPIYTIIGKDGNSFDYMMEGGKINIVG